jgi:Zn-dependent protease with chaperone function
MKKNCSGKILITCLLVWAMLALPLAVASQTQIKIPRNKYKIEDDLEIGRKYSAEIEKQLPILNDAESTRYIQSVGDRLEDVIPAQYRQPRFNCVFKIVNARDINAFALPGCYLYVNRGMIEAAKNEGEMAGVMAHEISHAMLRHSTAQATRQSNPLNQILGIGAIISDAIIGAPIAQTIYAGTLVFPYSREYETQADILGAQIMANAGYDPRDLANMFRTIESTGGGSGPEWLSTHPNPRNRYENINREAGLLRVSDNPIKMTRGFERIQAKFRSMPRAKSMKELEEEYKRNGGGKTQSTNREGRYESRVEYPSSQTRIFRNGNWIQMNVPRNWQEFESENTVEFAPQGAFGNQGITHGVLIGLAQTRSRNLEQATEEVVSGLLQSNTFLRQQTNYTRATISGRAALATLLAGTSPITRRVEEATVYTTMLRNGQVFYVVTVVPENEAYIYNNTFRNILRSIRLND